MKNAIIPKPIIWTNDEDDGSESQYYLKFDATPYSPKTWNSPEEPATLEDFQVECWVYHNRQIKWKSDESKSLGEWLESVINDKPDSPLREEIMRYCFDQLAEMARDGDEDC